MGLGLLPSVQLGLFTYLLWSLGRERNVAFQEVSADDRITHLSVNEQTGDIAIQERIQLSGIEEHVTTLLKDSSRRGHAHGMLEARMMAGEAMEVLQLVQKEVLREQTWTNRVKRNILGSIISSLTGLATQESIEQQRTYDKELRRKMEELVRTQQVEAHTIEQMVNDIAAEEETLDGRISQQQQMHQLDMAQLHQHNTRKYLVRQDMQALKDILASMHDRQATSNQRIRFMAKIQTGVASIFKFCNITIVHDTLIATYKAALYTTAQVEYIRPFMQAWQVRTSTATYIMQHQPLDGEYITLKEARIRGGTCQNCTLVIHTGQGLYKALQDGWIQCGGTGNSTVRTGDIIHIDDNHSCSNDILQIQMEHPRHDTLSIDMGMANTVDEQILQKYMANGSNIEGILHTHHRHAMAQQQLHKSILLAQQQMTDLTSWADRTEQLYDEHAWMQQGMPALIVLVALAIMGGMGAMGWHLFNNWKRRRTTAEEDPESGED